MPVSYRKRFVMTRHHRRNDARLTASLTLASVSGGLFLPLSLVYFTALTDIPLPMLGAIVSASVAIGLPLPLVAGVAVDRLGARIVVVGSLGLQAFAYASFVVVREPLEVLIASALMAIGVRLFWSSVFTYLADHAEAGSLASADRWFGRLNATRTVGIVVGGLVTGVAVSFRSEHAYVTVAWAAAACTAVATVLIGTVPHRGRANPNTRGRVSAPYAAIVRDRVFVRFLALNSALALATLFFSLSLPTVLRSGYSGPGWLTAVLLVANALAVALGSRRGAERAQRTPRVNSLTLAAVLWSAAFAIIAIGVSLSLVAATAVLLVGVVLLSAAEVLHAPASASLVDALSRGARGRYLAVFQYSFVAAELVGPVMFAALFSFAAALPFAALAVICGSAAWALHYSAGLRQRAE